MVSPALQDTELPTLSSSSFTAESQASVFWVSLDPMVVSSVVWYRRYRHRSHNSCSVIHCEPHSVRWTIFV